MKALLAPKLALAGIRKDRVTSLVVVGILALGLAAPATFFSILWGGGLRPLPVPGGDRVMRVEVLDGRGAGRAAPVSFRDVELLEGAPGVATVGAFTTAPLALTTSELGTLPVSGAVTTPATFQLLQVAPLLGRIPEGAEARDALILGHGVWVRHFEGSPSVLGAAVEVDGVARTVVAVMPDGFQFPFRQSVWLLADPGAPPEGTGVEAVLRLSDGVDPRQYVTTPVFTGSVAFSAGAARALGLLVGYDPVPTNPYHGEVWGGSRPNRFSQRQKKGLAEASRWYVELDGVDIV